MSEPVPATRPRVGPSACVAGHATHPDAHMALALVAAQVDAQRADLPAFVPTLAWLYLSDRLAHQAESVLTEVQSRWPGVQVVGAVAAGLCASGVEYLDEPALVLMLSDPSPSAFQVFHGRQPLVADEAWTALVHADPQLPELGELIAELAERTGSGYLFGGLSSSRTRPLQFANGVWDSGLSGVALAPGVRVLSRVTQGCQPLGPVRRLDRCEGNLAVTLNGQPALDVLLADLGLQPAPPQELAQRLRGVLAGLTAADDTALDRGGQFGADTLVRHVVGVDLGQGAVALAERLSEGLQLGWCRRDVQTARRDLVRICAELRDEADGDADASFDPGLDPSQAVQDGLADAAPAQGAARVLGAIYISCTGRGGAHFGGPSAELHIIRQALGEVPLVGFFAAGEIARHHLYGYTGVLTLLLADA